MGSLCSRIDSQKKSNYTWFTYSVLELRKAYNDLPNVLQDDIIWDQLPIATNYIVDYNDTYQFHNIRDRTKTWNPSRMSIRDHFHIENLCDGDEIGLYDDHYEYIKKLIHIPNI